MSQFQPKFGGEVQNYLVSKVRLKALSTFFFRYMVTEIGARDFGDTNRYNMLEVGSR